MEIWGRGGEGVSYGFLGLEILALLGFVRGEGRAGMDRGESWRCRKTFWRCFFPKLIRGAVRMTEMFLTQGAAGADWATRRGACKGNAATCRLDEESAGALSPNHFDDGSNTSTAIACPAGSHPTLHLEVADCMLAYMRLLASAAAERKKELTEAIKRNPLTKMVTIPRQVLGADPSPEDDAC